MDEKSIEQQIKEAVEAERERCIQIAVNEYARWKDVDSDLYGIAVGAIGGACNIVCAIMGVTAYAEPPVYTNERPISEILPEKADPPSTQP